MLVKTVTMLAAGAIALLLLTQPASGGHVRPKGASPLRVSYVIAQNPCAAPNRTHAGPFAFPSCDPAVQTSNFLTAGTADVNAAGSNLIGSLLLTVIPGNVNIASSITDVRCLPGESACDGTAPNVADGPDYIGQLQTEIGLRITDHRNGTSGTDPGTVIDFPLPVALNCTATANTAVGSTCGINTNLNAIVAGGVVPTDRTVFEIPQRTAMGGIQVFDGGASGVAGASDATLYLEPGLFVP